MKSDLRDWLSLNRLSAVKVTLSEQVNKLLSSLVGLNRLSAVKVTLRQFRSAQPAPSTPGLNRLSAVKVTLRNGCGADEQARAARTSQSPFGCQGDFEGSPRLSKASRRKVSIAFRLSR